MQVVDTFPVLQKNMQKAFLATVANHEALFTTDTGGLFDTYLSGFDDPEVRQHHNCNSCRKFIETYGGLVTLGADGEVRSAVWNVSDYPSEFSPSIALLRYRATSSPITGVFYTRETVWGIPKNYSKKHGHDWEHFYVTPPAKFVSRDRLKTPHELAMLAAEAYTMLNQARGEFKSVVDVALAILKSDSAARQEKFLRTMQGLKDSMGQPAWYVVANRPDVARIRSSVLGALLQDLAGGMSAEAAKKEFIKRVDPAYYMRVQSAPKTGNLKQAEEIVAKLGLAQSVKRRFATFQEVRGLAWTPKDTYVAAVGSVFANLYPKASPAKVAGPTMTWLKFVHDVLGQGVESISYVVPSERKPYAHITAAEVPGQPSLFKWGHEYSLYRWVSGTLPADFDLTVGEQVPLKGIGLLPHMWDNATSDQQGAFLYLEKGQDLNASLAGLGLHPDTLRQDLHSVRASFDHLSKSGQISGMPDTPGVKLTKGEPIDITLVVTVAGVQTSYKIDRWD